MITQSEPNTASTIFGENPLIAGLAPYCSLMEMPNRLANEPLLNLNWRAIAPAMREPLLDRIREHFVPTADAISIAMAIQNAIFESFRMRNPATQAERVRINRLLTLRPDSTEAQTIPLESPVAGGMIMAETGMGKSTILKTALKAIAPQSVVHHGRSEVNDWARLDHVPYLFVDFPANGTPWALCTALAGALDALLGTAYDREIARARNTDIAMFQVTKFILLHRVGCVVIDESQAGSFDESRAWGGVFIRYFKRLLNFGVPVVLSGHPDAFSELTPSAQLGRRFSGIGRFELVRAVDRDKAWWKDAFTKGVMRCCVVDSLSDPEAIRSAMSDRSAGVPDFYCVLWRETQRIALRRGGDKAEVTVADVEAALGAPGFLALAEMAAWLNSESPQEGRYLDLTPKLAPNISKGSTETVKDDPKRTKVPDAVKRLGALEKKQHRDRQKLDEAIAKATRLPERDLRRLVDKKSSSDESGGLVQASLTFNEDANKK